MTDGTGNLVGRAIELIDLLGGTDVRELEVQEGNRRIRLRRKGAELRSVDIEIEAPLEFAPAVEPILHQVRSPIVGTFYRSARAGDPPMVKEGTRVTEDTVVGIVEALQIPTEIEAGSAGTIVAVLAADGQAVEYGQGLVEIAPDG